MRVFDWEQSISDFAATFPRSGLFFDFMHFISHPGLMGWALWISILVLIFRRQLKKVFPVFLISIAAAGIGDLVSRRLIKAFVLRPRPGFIHEACIDSHCWGFVSSHATNVTAFVTVFCCYDRKNLNWGLPAILLVSISRIYLLDHFPLDVLGGILLGAFIGIFVFQGVSKLKTSKKRKN